MSLAVLALALAVQAQPQAKPAPRVVSPNFLPIEIRKAVNEANNLCKESGGKPGKSSKLITFVDLTGDGVIDFVMDLNNYQCEGAASALSAGQSGSALTIFVGGPNNTAKEAYHAMVQAPKVITVGSSKRLYVGVMGVDCGQKNAAKKALADLEVCMRPLNWKADKQVFVLGPLSEKRAFSIQ
jgi:hypothetical protein